MTEAWLDLFLESPDNQGPDAASVLAKAVAALGAYLLMGGLAVGGWLLVAAVGGPLALVRDGDEIELDVEAGRLELLVADGELARRREQLKLPKVPARGWRRLYAERVMQANLGADLDFMVDADDA